ncbi:sigma-54-dependent Fis family transcriptional regulator [Parapedobacter sp. ISTM3]|uniref:Two-component system, NtrC family, response regulator HydG n=1 Tax=Parapedobacter luteus TaxID=623280 RepID=A0A1T5AZQ5_9SPHI|nr:MULTISPECIES: sigma-54 dependent transcriptional regulator [Parapedobacter]MBK1440402.1 sigma-54-dependent Fis family transcriptional regulator [Parapedobacter sp. ISTM3]SKB40488.1 two-component system, NtrC family, response regulator HydG [Parapedobacter luteus]
MANILLVEDDTTFAAILENFLKKKGFEVVVKYSVKSGIEALKHDSFHLILLDYRLGDGIGLDVVEALHAEGKIIPSIIMTSFNDVRTAVKAIRQGVFDYITKPVNPDELLMVVNEALEGKSTEKEPAVMRSRIAGITGNTMADFVEGTSAAARKLHEYIALVAPTDMSVLIRGESGTGKEYVARSIHQRSMRADKPFISIDCGTLSKELASSELFGHIKGSFTGALNDKTGQFVEASGGTLFLDEIGNLSYDVQVKLLRALQEKVIQPVGANKTINVDVRVIAATNEDLLGSGKFREDLYHRINEFEIIVPALRDRRADFQQFVDFFIKKANEELGRGVVELSEEVKDIFHNYDWPGNLRELKNVIKRMVLLSPGAKAEVAALPEEMVFAIKNPAVSTETIPTTDTPDLRLHSEAHERKLILDVLQKAKYNKSKAAQMLNIDRKTLYNKMEKYGIE